MQIPDQNKISSSELPIVMLSMSRWDGDFSSASWSLAKTFAENNIVYYVDYPYTWLDVWRECNDPRVIKRKSALLFGKDCSGPVPGKSSNLRYITPRPMLPINWAPASSSIYRLLSTWNNMQLFKAIHQVLKKDGFDSFILFNSFNPLYGYKRPRNLNIPLFVYQSRDNLRALEPYLKKHGEQLEILCLQNADFSIATSKQLVKDLSALSGKNVHFFPNAADFDLFVKASESQLTKPEDIQSIRTKIIGYTGNICQRLDYDLIVKLARKFSNHTIVMVGPKNFYKHTHHDLDNISNIHFCGAKNIEQLPSYLAHFDVLIMPFICNELTKSIYPLKINEYLASGKPVISTQFSDDISEFEDVVLLSDTHDHFLKHVEEGLLDNNPDLSQKRIKLASQNSWKSRVEMFWQLADSFYSKKT